MQNNNIKLKLVLIIFIVVLSDPLTTVGTDSGELSVGIYEPNVWKKLQSNYNQKMRYLQFMRYLLLAKF